ncbi:protein aardvark [Anaeramoeba ignava]|uniref:Protein aardvark n=1 Tax=Anaeramoeba ignava TaxID=1746090 RepID=A0A9Q0LVF7_ANAIG|nr:protein aardvark [Anaeramoeba ignava]
MEYFTEEKEKELKIDILKQFYISKSKKEFNIKQTIISLLKHKEIKEKQKTSQNKRKNESKPKTKNELQKLKEFLIKKHQKQILSIFNKKKTSDIQIYCGIDKRILYCHKSILTARSLTFLTKIFEKQQTKLIFNNFHSNIVTPIMEYIYSGELSFNKEEFDKYWEFANQNKLNDVKKQIELEMKEYLQLDNIANIYFKSQNISSRFLIEKCEEFIIPNIQQIIQRFDFKNSQLEQNISFVGLISLHQSIQNKFQLLQLFQQKWKENTQENIYKLLQKQKKEGLNRNSLIKLNQNETINSQEKEEYFDNDKFFSILFTQIQQTQTFTFQQFQKIKKRYTHNFDAKIGSLNKRISKKFEEYQGKKQILIGKELQKSKIELDIKKELKEKEKLEIYQSSDKAKIYFEKLKNSIQENDKDETKELLQIDIALFFICMKNFPNNEYIQENCCLALRKFTDKRKRISFNLPNLKGFNLIIKAMNNFPFNRFLQLQSILIIINIGKENENKTQIETNSGIDTIITTMVNFTKDKEIYNKGIEALGVLGLDKKEIVEKIIQEKLKRLNEEYRKSKPGEKVHFFINSFQNIKI